MAARIILGTIGVSMASLLFGAAIFWMPATLTVGDVWGWLAGGGLMRIDLLGLAVMVAALYVGLKSWQLSYVAFDQLWSPPIADGHQPAIVYIVRNGDGHHKIGQTVNLQSRLNSLRTASSTPLELVQAFETDDAAGLERMLHHRFDDKRLAGEWFSINDADLAQLLEELELERIQT